MTILKFMSGTNNLPVVILAGGENSRFFPLNTDTHKGAIVICGKPIIVRTIENLIEAHVSHVYIIVSKKDFYNKGLSSEIKKYNLSVKIDFILQKKANGMGNALLLVRKFIKEKKFCICFPYTVEAGTILKKANSKRNIKSFLTLTTTKTPWLYGIVAIKKDRVIGVVEKPPRGYEPSNLKIQGLYVLSRNFLNILSEINNHEYSFEEALQKLTMREKVSFIKLKKPLLTLKYPWHLFSFLKLFLGKKQNYIGNYCNINNAINIKNSFIGDNVEIGKGVKITNSIILNNSIIKSSIESSIIASNVFIDENLKFNKQNKAHVYSIVKNKIINTNLKKFNIVAGSGSSIGKNVSIKAGVFIGSNAIIKNGTNITENILHKL